MDVDRNLYVVDLGITDPFMNLAIEECLYESLKARDCWLFLWQNDKSVILGRGQSVYSQCNLEMISKLGINIVRRRSGGGTVYHDLGNLNYSIISEYDDNACDNNMQCVCKALQKFNISAFTSGRNDITVDGKKFSGNAYVCDGNKICHHGTILIDSDFSVMYEVLNVSEDKWKDKGIDSVRSRTVNLSSYNAEITVENMKKALIEAVISKLNFQHIYTVSSLEDITASLHDLNRLYTFYKSDEWRYEKHLDESINMRQRFSWGDIEIEIQLEKNHITDIQIFSDMLETNIIPNISACLKGTSFTRNSICERLERIRKDRWLATEKLVFEDIKSLIMHEAIDNV